MGCTAHRDVLHSFNASRKLRSVLFLHITGFLSYDEFQSQALGVGAAVSAVTLLFWVAVLLLVSKTGHITATGDQFMRHRRSILCWQEHKDTT